MHTECLTPQCLEVLRRLKGIVHIHDFLLAGGSALALRLGHRISVDLDFFTERPFSTEKIFQEMQRLELAPVIQQEEEGTLTTATTGGVKVSLFHYPYPFVDEKKDMDGIPLAGVLDIASMKLIAISQRGAKRDFIDLYFILQDTPFWKIAANMVKRFGADRINPVNIGKSLVYFHDADIDPDPRYIGKKTTWKTVKTFYVKHIQQMVIDLQKARS